MNIRTAQIVKYDSISDRVAALGGMVLIYLLFIYLLEPLHKLQRITK